MATIEELAATFRAGILTALGRTIDADKAEWTLRGLAMREADRSNYNIDTYTIPEDYLDLAGSWLLRYLDQAYLDWDQHRNEDPDGDSLPRWQDPDSTTPDADGDGVTDDADPAPLDPTIPQA